MKRTAKIMGMKVVIQVMDQKVGADDFRDVFNYLRQIDRRYSPFKPNSLVSQINNGSLIASRYDSELRKIIRLCQWTKKKTAGFFNPYHNGRFDPSGLVKGYSIKQAADLLYRRGFRKIYLEIAGDIQLYGPKPWRVGIANPFNPAEVIKVVALKNRGIATSGQYYQQGHIYNPHKTVISGDIVSVTVIGPNVDLADRLSTAVFAMGKNGPAYLRQQSKYAGYFVTSDRKAFWTDNFTQYVVA